MRMTGVNWSTQRKTCPRNPAWIGLWLKMDTCGERNANEPWCGLSIRYSM